MPADEHPTEGVPTTPEIVEAIDVLAVLLGREYGEDYAFTILGRGRTLAASSAALGVVLPISRSVEPVESAWFRQGFEDGADGRTSGGPLVDWRGVYERGYRAGREQYLREQGRDS